MAHNGMRKWTLAEQGVRLLDGRWTLAILAELFDGGRRYQALDEVLKGVSHKVLTETLRRAERDGLIERRLDPERVETATIYELTDLGYSLSGPLDVLDSWAERNWSEVDRARQLWRRRNV